MRSSVLHLIEMARQIRGKTLQQLGDSPDKLLLWAPTGTSNHVVWHLGHVLWVQDCLCVVPLTGKSELPSGWSDKFGMNCQPVSETRDWPAREDLSQLLETQLHRMLGLFEQHSDRLSQLGSLPDSGWELTRGVVHGLHDEAKHQGEIHLLRKLRATFQ